MTSDMSAGNIYLNVVVRINDDYGKLLQHLEEMDTRTAYLRMFEMSLSSALPKPLWESDRYIQQSKETPLPTDPYAMLDFETFRAWMAVYELVMREEGLIGTRRQSIIGLDDEEVNERERQRVHV